MGGYGGAAVGLQAASSGMGVFKSIGEANILRQNATIYERNIPYIRAQAAEKARQLQAGKYTTLGAQRTGYAGRGLAVGGSVMDVMNDTVTNFNRDTSFVLMEGELAAQGQQRSADLSRYQARSGIRDAVAGGALNTLSMVARAYMPTMGSSMGGYTQNPYQPA